MQPRSRPTSMSWDSKCYLMTDWLETTSPWISESYFVSNIGKMERLCTCSRSRLFIATMMIGLTFETWALLQFMNRAAHHVLSILSPHRALSTSSYCTVQYSILLADAIGASQNEPLDSTCSATSEDDVFEDEAKQQDGWDGWCWCCCYSPITPQKRFWLRSIVLCCWRDRLLYQ